MVHHSQVKQAEKIGAILSEVNGMYDAFWPKRNLHIFGASGGDAIKQMKAAQALDADAVAAGNTVLWTHHPDDLRLTNARDAHNKWLSTEYRTPHQLLEIWKETGQFVFDFEPPVLADELLKDADGDGAPESKVDNIARSDKGVALDGAIAYAEGTLSADCPFSSEDEEEYDQFVEWNDAWDAAADAKAEEEPQGGSVVKEKYRAIYAERGHPTHCGDWLAQLLNNLVLGKKATDIARFEAICAANGVDLSKYKHEGKGWEGRLRMTGRNLLAKKVFFAGGVLQVPNGEVVDTYTAPADWMQAQRFKAPPAATSTPTPAPAQAA